MFGELSASHLFTGITQPNSALIGMGTRNDALGIYLDDAYTGAG
jgi:tricorn protease